MKRRIAVSLAVLAAALAGCSPAPQEIKGKAQDAPAGWSQPPRIQSVEATSSGLLIRGQAGAEARVVLRDAVGNALEDGCDVTIAKDLKVKGTSVTLKRGQMCKNIRLTDDPDLIECNVEKVKGLVLRTEFVKKA